jgi:hypothetical protein
MMKIHVNNINKVVVLIIFWVVLERIILTDILIINLIVVQVIRHINGKFKFYFYINFVIKLHFIKFSFGKSELACNSLNYTDCCYS